jgi:heme exporter protein A
MDFTLDHGEFVVLFGPNGAGKSTLLGLLAGSLQPTRGEIRISGLEGDADEKATAWRRRIGVLSHQTFLYSQLTARENLEFYGRLYGLERLDARIDELLEAVGLQDRAEQRVKGFSRGMQQRLALARTLLHDPGLVLLDEPYTGLDPHAALLLRGLLEQLRTGHRTVVMITHNLTQGLELATRVVIQAEGRWVMDRPRSEVDGSSFEAFYTETLGELV